jgi:APA family basic amino acid/polyamine antiporter
MATIGVLGSNFAGDFFLGIDIMVTSMLVNFLLMCITVLTLKKYNYNLYQEISVFKKRIFQLFIGWGGIIFLSGFLIIHSYKDLQKEVEAWYFHSTYIWLLVMLLASSVFLVRWNKLKKTKTINKFKYLPLE